MDMETAGLNVQQKMKENLKNLDFWPRLEGSKIIKNSPHNHVDTVAQAFSFWEEAYAHHWDVYTSIQDDDKLSRYVPNWNSLLLRNSMLETDWR